MEYHHQHNPHHAHMNGHQQHQQHYHQNPPMTMLGNNGSLSLPDASSSNEKALMWSHTQYMSESGYSTQAPSISSVDAYNLNNNNNNESQMDSTMHQMEPQIQQLNTAASISSSQSTIQQTSIQPTPVDNWNMPPQQQQQGFKMDSAATVNQQAAYQQQQQLQQPQQQQQQPQPQPAQSTAEDDSKDLDNAVANWINYQDNSEMALKAIPELLKLLNDEDLVVVQQAAILFNQMSRNEGPRMALIQTTNAVQCLVDCLISTTDTETARSLVGTLYSISTQKPIGCQILVNSKALDPLVKMLLASVETIVSYAITTLHNVLLECGDQVKTPLRKMGAIQYMIPLLQNTTNVKFLSILVDCLQILSFHHPESKQVILEMGGTKLLITILTQCQYPKLLLNTFRLIKVLSVCNQNKTALINYNAMQALSMHLSIKNADILQACLIAIRNLSDAATRLNGLEQLVQLLFELLASSTDVNTSVLCAGILSNLTCYNENNKKAALRHNAIQILLQIIQANMFTNHKLVEPCVCALRHITNKYSDMLLAQEQVRTVNGLSLIAQLMSVKPRNWQVIKAVLGVVRNFCSNQLNSNHLRSIRIIEKLMQILYDAYTDICNTDQSANPVVKRDDVNLLEIVDGSCSALLLLAKENQNQIIMKDLDCLGFFMTLFYSPVAAIQRSAASLLAELASNKECADVIDEQPGLNSFILANFCNQFGQLKTIAEITGTNGQTNQTATITVILQHVTTLMQRLQDHKNNQRAFMLQQQQRPQQFPQQYPQQAQPLIQSQQQVEQFAQINCNQPQQQQHQSMMYYNSQMNMQTIYPPQQVQQAQAPQQNMPSQSMPQSQQFTTLTNPNQYY